MQFEENFISRIETASEICIILHMILSLIDLGCLPFDRNFESSGWNVNGKVTFRKFQPKIEDYVLR